MKYYTDQEWKSIPLKLKQKWWKETNYGKLKPSTQLLKEVNETLNGTQTTSIKSINRNE